ncbi:S-layer protein [Levilactobacillus humaensis]|uniref:S-layer protein n=1 Tax=Levilactobacillus humaensis TaxID=2950375 RepID=UPI0028526591|nr:S-layer protein [Levilactobacillus humaensis]
MQSSLKKSLYLGLAALSFVSVAAVSTNASAKSYAKAGAETDLTVNNKAFNVESTGTNALFTKPGTTKGAKVVASKATMKKLANSGKSADYFWAYRTTTTNKGAVYYKVVSMNGKYRGYVYAGKTEGAVSRGLKKADTTTKAAMPTITNVYLKDSNKNTLWNAPKYTAHKAHKVSLQGVTKGGSFTVLNAATKTRENTLYYYVQSNDQKDVKGWVYAGGTSTDSNAAESYNSVNVKFQLADGTPVGSSTWVDKSATDTTAAGKPVGTEDANVNSAGIKLADFIKTSSDAKGALPNGYSFVSSNPADMANATYGGVVTVTVGQNASSKYSFYTPSTTTTAPTKLAATDLNGGLPAVNVALYNKYMVGAAGTQLSVDNLDKVFGDASFTAFQSVQKTAPTDATELAALNAIDKTDIAAGAPYFISYAYDQGDTDAANAKLNYGETAKIYVTPTVTPGTVDNGTSGNTSSNVNAE